VSSDPECTWPKQFGAWAERSPNTRVLCGSKRSVLWRLRPPSRADLAAVLTEARTQRTALWPVSRGCNWGYGSHLPARDGAVIVDLSELKAISDFDPKTQSVRIEPGVTQGMLHDYLRSQAPGYAFNVTGAGVETSVLGNALERGIGYGGEKDRDVYALEVMLADGSVAGPVAGHTHPARNHPAGLSTDALFFQTNFGIVLSARFRLRLKQEAEDAVVLQGPLDDVIVALKRAYDARLLSEPTHVAEPGRSARLGAGLLRSLWGRYAEKWAQPESLKAIVPGASADPAAFARVLGDLCAEFQRAMEQVAKAKSWVVPDSSALRGWLLESR
jgi:4-cresol dehydrogenase (hydroxylating) flavoprotein subunit